MDFSNKAQQKRSEMASLQQRAQVLQTEINAKQQELTKLNGN